MKKRTKIVIPYLRLLEKTWLKKSIRKIVCLLILLQATTFYIYSQITVNIENETLRTSLKQIERISDYRFFYNESLSELDSSVSLNVNNATINKTMQQLLSKFDLTYKLEKKKTIVIVRKDKIDKNIKLSGRVVDERGDPVIGASVYVKETFRGNITDINGNFSLEEVPEFATLSISYIGYKTLELPATSKQLSNIILAEDTEVLDEIVVVGYGVQKRSDITGSVSSIKADDLLSAPNPSAAQALQGRAAGVVVQNKSGSPSGDISIRIRGSNSLTYGNDPLIIIDGVQGANLGSLNPNQIESMEILKDAAALSVYGSKGANGVVLVTTKSGKSGKAQISYNSFVSFDQVRKTLPSLNATEYVTLFNESQVENGLKPLFTSDEAIAFGEGTNWQDEIFRNALSQTHNLSVSGGKEGISYNIAGGYTNKEGIILNTGFKQYSLRSNFKAQVTSRLNIALNTFTSYEETHNGDYSGAITSALRWSPTKNVYDDDGEYVQPGGGVGPVSYNPVGLAKEIVDENSVSSFSTSLTAEYKFLDCLKLSSLFSYKTNSSIKGNFNNQVVNNGPIGDVSGEKTQSRYTGLQSTSILTFDKALGDHNLQITGVYEVLKDNYQNTWVSSRGIPVGLGYNGIHFGSTLQQPWLGYSTTVIQSFMGRANYSYKNRYMFSASIRIDGASQLADGHKYDDFSAFSVGWNLMEENFMEDLKNIIPEFKIRGSYGSVGNAAVPAFASQLTFTPGLDADLNPTLSIAQLSNENLKWERTQEFNIGVDTRFWGGRLNFSAEYYNKKTTDLLMWQKVPTALGVSSVLSNVGSVANKGYDFSIGGIPISTKHFKWDINYTLNLNNNKILALDGLSDMLIYSSDADSPGLVGSFVQMVGEPMGTFLGYTYAGVWKQSEISTAAIYGAKPGDAKYVDLNNDGKINKDDIGIIGNAQPKFSFGFNNTFTIYDFDVNIFLQGVTGNDIQNQNRMRRELYSSKAFPTSPVMKDHWTPENETDVPAFSGTELINSSRWIENGSYLRLKNVTIGYRLPRTLLSKVGVSSARLYVSGNNLLTITGYKGFDPEASIGTDAVAAGVDRGIYPASKSFLVGIDISF
ncbi:TonB-dependent receptor [Parabacteroides sp. BX2]|jgi:TonB-dependent starch-binding outer membrane protein SusC|uniref:TonB-dependent receptor n=1 Tax=Parabacteroides segnis TaxID=2763058 RepID=A0ABR7E967_9BACT|nr:MULTISPECIES: TonB-dependent receptor [Parabacteroides]MBC5646307.1 TonB-dependent receptor [Parabacteroides segnis]MCM0716264.1 TonB-dependent receptor [Parabacteroides sp. TA-V-105]